MSISIHAPREGGDIAPNNSSLKPNGNFNPRPPRGGRPSNATIIYDYTEFQSTPPARGATASLDNKSKDTAISIHAPREGGDPKMQTRQQEHFLISIHAPREGGDDHVHGHGAGGGISIHAPREGGDHGQRRSGRGVIIFQSTPPARGAT